MRPETQVVKRTRNGRWKPGASGSPATRWKPGRSGNPAGRPPGVKFVSEVLREALLRDEPGKTSRTERIVKAILDRAEATGDPTAFREIVDRIEGKVTLPVGGPDGRDLLPPACRNMTRVDLIAETKALLAIAERGGAEDSE